MFGPFSLSATGRQLEREGVPVDIGSRALDILIVLIEEAGKIICNRELIARVWRDVVVEESSLRVNIAGLRRALDDGRDGARYIANVPSQGYCFVAPLARTAAAAAIAQPGVDSLPPVPHVAQAARFLPKPLARMVGRDALIPALRARIMAHRFVNIVGPGGMGKTTVAIAVAHALLDEFDGAVCFFDLGALSAPELLASTMAATLGLPAVASDPLHGLAASLQDRRILLLLDNCEHLADAVATLTERLFHDAPHVFILATSRESLRVEGEHIHRLAPLDSPPQSETLTAAAALAFPAIQLFVERAAANGNPFALQDDDAAVVAEICRKLDGIALAIELGAGRVAAYGVRGTAALLDNRFRLSWHGRRTALPRHQTLNAMLDWSYNLLPEFERMVLRRLATFIGPFSLADARQIAVDAQADDMQVIEAVGSLVAKSLASVETGMPDTRYRLLESARVYASEKLRESGEMRAIAQRHALLLIAFFGTMETGSATFPQAGALAGYVDSLGNLRKSLAWCFSDAGDPAIGARLCVAAAPLMLGLSLLGECSAWSGKALALPGAGNQGDAHEMALREAHAISSMFAEGNSDSVLLSIQRGLDLACSLGSLPHELRLLAGLNIFQTRIGDFAAAVQIAERSIAVAKKLGDTAALAMAEWMLGVALHLAGDQAGAQRHCENGLALVAHARSVNTIYFGYDHRIRALVALARALWLRGFPERANQVAWQAVHEADAVGHPVTVCISLIYAAPVLMWNGDWTAAEELIGKLIVHAKKHGIGPYHAVGIGYRGALLVKRGEPAAGVELLYDCLNVLRSGRHTLLNSVFISALAEGLAMLGKFDEARCAIADVASNCMETFDAPEILRIRGEVLAAMAHPDTALAEACLLQSRDCARRQQALGWELCTTITLARLLMRGGRRLEAQRMLGEVLGRFSEGHATRDHVMAREMLAACAAMD